MWKSFPTPLFCGGQWKQHQQQQEVQYWFHKSRFLYKNALKGWGWFSSEKKKKKGKRIFIVLSPSSPVGTHKIYPSKQPHISSHFYIIYPHVFEELVRRRRRHAHLYNILLSSLISQQFVFTFHPSSYTTTFLPFCSFCCCRCFWFLSLVPGFVFFGQRQQQYYNSHLGIQKYLFGPRFVLLALTYLLPFSLQWLTAYFNFEWNF